MKFFVLLAFSLLGKFVCMAQTDSIKSAVPSKVAVTAFKAPPSVLLYPNPVKNKAELQLTGFEQGLAQLQIISAAGRVESLQQRLLMGGKETLVIMFSLKPGIYYTIIKQANKIVKARMAVQ